MLPSLILRCFPAERFSLIANLRARTGVTFVPWNFAFPVYHGASFAWEGGCSAARSPAELSLMSRALSRCLSSWHGVECSVGFIST